jgi:flagellar motor switch protein FliN/FliY
MSEEQTMETFDPAACEVLEAAPGAPAPQADAELGRLHAVPVDVAVQIGRTQMTIGEALGLAPGAVVALDRMAGEPVDLLVNGHPIARGEVVVVDEQFGLRVTELLGARAQG